MKTVLIRGIDFSTPEELHTFLAEELGFPEYYGKNLDALHDELTGIGDSTEIIVDFRDLDNDVIYEYLGRVAQVLQDSAKENESLEIVLR